MLLLPAISAAPAAAVAGASPSEESGDHRLGASVLAAPQRVPATDQRFHVVYEVILQNLSQQAIRLDRVEVRDARRGRVVATYGAPVIERLLFGLQAGAFTRTLAAGESGMLLLDITARTGAAVPARLSHRFTLSTLIDGVPADRFTTTGAMTSVDLQRPLRLSPPLRGTDLAVFGCCGPPFAHRLALVDFGGQSLLAQRYAIDFARLDDGLNTFTGDPARNESYFIYGDEVRAAAPGRVVAARNTVPENTPPNPPANPGVDDLTGNFVLQELGHGSFALYAHLQTGSVQVRPGDQLRRGQPLGRVGNTGNSTEPHLHFHVTDGPGLPSGLAANGIPYVFDHMRLQGRIEGLDSTPPAPVRQPAQPPHRRAGQYPLTGDILRFR